MVIFFSGIFLYIFLVIYAIFIIYFRYFKQRNVAYLLFFTIFYIYIYYLIDLTQFPIYIDDEQREMFGGQNVWKEMNLIPFKYGISIANFYNIIMTIPLGFGIPFLMKTDVKKIFLIGLVTTITIESFQLLTALYAGYTFRVVDINDIILNTFGALIGYLLFFKLFKFIYNYLINKFKVDDDKGVVLKHISSYVNQ
ncbi:VanZ family protein [Pseudogracilibacillus sp. SO30301A]|uniref:VanZ family protein n=1 Tax=Pseudogracilibacillus sp. SO30301A TaxID=3098291 RepID=UPI00300DF43A